MSFKRHIKDIYIDTIYTQNYALKCTIKYIAITYIFELLKLLLFPKICFFFVLVYIKMMELNRKKYIIIEKSRGIIDPQKMSTKELINTLTRYDSRRKVKNIRRKLLNIEPEKIAKIQNISQNELNQVEKLQRKSIDGLKEIARLWKIKNREKLTKEELIIGLLKSASSVAEHNFNNDNSNNTD